VQRRPPAFRVCGRDGPRKSANSLRKEPRTYRGRNGTSRGLCFDVMPAVKTRSAPRGRSRRAPLERAAVPHDDRSPLQHNSCPTPESVKRATAPIGKEQQLVGRRRKPPENRVAYEVVDGAIARRNGCPSALAGRP
jgi:hypothetical protein